MKSTLRVIQLGVGGFGRYWRYALRNTPSVEVVGLVDISGPALEEGATFWNVPKGQCFSIIESEWDKVDADIVIDSTPHLFHHTNALKVFSSGKNLIVVKPMSDQWESGLDMVQMAEKKGCKMVVAQQLRFHPLIMKVREIIQSGALGKLGYVHLDGFFGRPPPAGMCQRPQWRQPYPLVVECSIHHFDFLRWCVGQDAESVWGEIYNPPWITSAPIHDVYAVFTMEDDCRVVYRGITTMGRGTSWLCNWRVEGTDEVLTVVGDRLYVNDQEIPLAWPDGSRISDLKLELLNKVVFDQSISYFKGGEEPSISGKNNLNSLAMVFGIIKSSQEGRRLALWRR